MTWNEHLWTIHSCSPLFFEELSLNTPRHVFPILCIALIVAEKKMRLWFWIVSYCHQLYLIVNTHHKQTPKCWLSTVVHVQGDRQADTWKDQFAPLRFGYLSDCGWNSFFCNNENNFKRHFLIEFVSISKDKKGQLNIWISLIMP